MKDLQRIARRSGDRQIPDVLVSLYFPFPRIPRIPRFTSTPFFNATA